MDSSYLAVSQSSPKKVVAKQMTNGDNESRLSNFNPMSSLPNDSEKILGLIASI